MWRTWEIGTHTFPIVWVLFFPLDSHSMVYFVICKIHGFPFQFPIAWENALKSIELGEPRKLIPIFSLTYGYFSSIRFPFYGIFCYHRGNSWFFPSKSSLRALWLFFHSITFSTCFSIDSLKEKTKKPDKVNSFFKKRKTNSRHAGIQSQIYQKKKSEWT